MKIALLFSSGKDSTYSGYYYESMGWTISCLVSIIPENKDSFMFQKPEEAIIKAEAEAWGKPLIIINSSGEKEKELEELKKGIRRAIDDYDVEGVVVGALASDYQQERVNSVCEELGIRVFAPLWHKDQLLFLEHLVRSGIKAMIVKVSALGLGEKDLGRIVDERFINDIEGKVEKYGLNPSGEGGEFETTVIDAPFFKKKILFSYKKVMTGKNEGFLEIEPESIRLVDKKSVDKNDRDR